MKKVLLLSALSATLALSEVKIPTVIFHGMGDACDNYGMAKFVKSIENQVGTYTVCIEVGSGALTSIFDNFEDQGEKACKKVLKDPQL